MDFLNKAFAQFNDLFRSMSPGGRITAGLLLIVAVVSVGYLFQTQVTGGDDKLFGGASIPTPTLEKMEGAFGKAGLNGFSIEGGQVKVPHSQRDKYLAALAEAKALPPNFGDPYKEADQGGMFESPLQREQRQHHAKEAEITQILNALKGIERATVIIDKQAPAGGLGDTKKTASVYAQAVGGVPLDDDQVDTIRYCVVGANAGMKPENVTIADGNGYIYPGPDMNRGRNDPYAVAVRSYEKDLEAKIRAALVYIPNMTVKSTVTVDHDKDSRSVEVKNDPKPVPVQVTEVTANTSHDAGSTGGAPGFPQRDGANQPAKVNGNETSETSKSQQVNVVSSTSTVKETAGLTPKTAKVTIGIPASYFEKVWAKDHPPEDGKDSNKPKPEDIKLIADKITQEVRAAAANLLPIGPEIKDPTSLVTVTTFQDIKSAAILGPPVTERAMSWLSQNWPMAAMVGLVLFSLNVLRSLLRSVPATVQSAAPATLATRVSAADSKPEESKDSVEVTAARRLHRMTGSGPSLRDELSEFVKEDPDSAANILRTWIGQVT